MFVADDLRPCRIDHRIGQAAILGAFSAIGTTSTQSGAQITLPAIADAEGAVHKYFQRNGSRFRCPANLVQRQFTCQNHLCKACGFEETDLFRCAVVRLRAA